MDRRRFIFGVGPKSDTSLPVPYSDAYEVVKTWTAWRDYKDLPEILEKSGDPYVGSPRRGLGLRRELPRNSKTDWCAVHFGVQDITNWALRVLGEMDASATMAKFSRVQKWANAVGVTRVQQRVVEGFLKEAATELEKERFVLRINVWLAH